MFVYLFTVVTSFSHLRPPERDLTPFSQMKSVKSLRHAGFTAVFTGQAVSWLVHCYVLYCTVLHISVAVAQEVEQALC